MSNLKISLLGKPIVEFKGSSVKFRRRKTIALLAYLALNPGTHHRDSLIALLWPDSNQQKGRHGLRQLIWDFTAITEKPMLIMDDDSLGLSESQNIWVDTRLFFELTGGIQFRVDERNPKLPDDLVQAIVLVKGDFLSGFALSRIPEFEDWQVIQSEKIRQRLADTLEWLTGFFQETQDFKQALQYAQRWSAMDLLDEKSQRAQIRLLAFNNQRSLAIKHYNKLIQSLESELGVEPEEETLSLFQAISNNTLQIGSVHSLKPQLFSDTSQRSLKPFFGRHKELAKISALLEGKKCRLLTLIGPGGVGKTSLAMEVLRKIKPAFCDGLFYISLVTIESDQALILAIGSTVGMAVNEVIDPKSGLLSYLKDKNLLLILDHFEQLTACSHSIADIVDAAPKVKILVTSRERLRLQQEWLLNIEGLPVKSPGNIGLSEAAELFFQTAIRVNPEFNLKQELNDMTTICQQVEGLPLAIELAASWTRTLSCNEIHQEIEESLDFLTSSNINIAAQHRSIRAVFDASWERLSEKHKQILKNLSIFEDSMSTDACQSVAKASIADLLELQDNSVLSRTKAGLFRLHDLIRQFSSEKRNKDFAESGQLDDRFVKYYAYFAQHQLQLLKGKDQEQSISKIKETFSNLIKALHLALSKPQWDSFGEIFSVLLLYFEMSNQYKDGILELQNAINSMEDSSLSNENKKIKAFLMLGNAVARRLVNHVEDVSSIYPEIIPHLGKISSSVEALVCLKLGWLYSWEEGKSREATFWIEKAKSFYLQTGDIWGQATVLYTLGETATYAESNFVSAIDLYRKSLELQEKNADTRSRIAILNALGKVKYELYEYEDAEQFHYQALKLSRAVNDQNSVLFALGQLGNIAFEQKRFEKAKEYARQSCELAENLGIRVTSAWRLYFLGRIAIIQGEVNKAHEFFEKSYQIFKESHHQLGLNKIEKAIYSLSSR